MEITSMSISALYNTYHCNIPISVCICSLTVPKSNTPMRLVISGLLLCTNVICELFALDAIPL